ncbi:MAG: HPF/RaiA family ribosome-associated protein [Chloroflexi bacterium]|nr:HPF/RaiA family ribosome-associated protein [Chloroflexota bacterium]
MADPRRPGEHRNLPVDRGRHETIVPEAGHDPYRLLEEPPAGAACGVCGLVYRDGRWAWRGGARTLKPPPGGPAGAVLCPACRRIHDSYPAGIVTLRGGWLATHLGEVLDVIRVNADLELQEHPQNRLMTLDTHDGEVEVTTTGIHLARRIGDALRDAYKGQLAVDYLQDAEQVRVTWTRADLAERPQHAPAVEPLVEVIPHDIALTPEVRDYLDDRIGRLPEFYPRILSSRVVLRGETRHHQAGGPFSVHVYVDVPQRVIVVTRQQRDDLHVAIREAFDAAQRQLQDLARKQRGEVSPTTPPPRGRVARVFQELGYGFINTAEGDVYFHRNAVLERRFDEIEAGSEVRYELETGEKGLQASTVALLADH